MMRNGFSLLRIMPDRARVLENRALMRIFGPERV
jgi:hypothetical protein